MRRKNLLISQKIWYWQCLAFKEIIWVMLHFEIYQNKKYIESIVVYSLRLLYIEWELYHMVSHAFVLMIKIVCYIITKLTWFIGFLTLLKAYINPTIANQFLHTESKEENMVYNKTFLELVIAMLGGPRFWKVYFYKEFCINNWRWGGCSWYIMDC